jgi:hypothetical protein
VGREIALVPFATVADDKTPRSALHMTWSSLVEMLDLGAEPEFRECPNCKHPCALRASRCGHCWTSLPALTARSKLAA